MFQNGAEVRAAVMRLVEKKNDEPANLSAGEVVQLLIRCGAQPLYDEVGAFVGIDGIDYED